MRRFGMGGAGLQAVARGAGRWRWGWLACGGAALFVLAGLAGPAAGQRPGCGYGAALAGLAAAAPGLAPPAGLVEGRAQAAAAVGPLQSAAAGLAGCGCARLAEAASAAAETAMLAMQADAMPLLGRRLDRARFALAEAQGLAGRLGCR